MEKTLSVGEAISVVVEAIRKDSEEIRYNGRAINLQIVRNKFSTRVHSSTPDQYSAFDPAPMDTFYAAAWELCRRGILRPAPCTTGNIGQTASDLGMKDYFITPLGKKWLSEVTDLEFIPPEPNAIGHLLGQFRNQFGDGFHQRAQEAARCYGAHANLAACVMAGAAAEAILLATATAKTGDGEKVIKAYGSSKGRSRVMDMVVGQATAPLSRQFRSSTSLLDYWRDEAAHGRVSAISELEAHDALARLIRFAQFVTDNWGELTDQPSG